MNRQYIGARYVPKFYVNPNGTHEWLNGVSYEALTIVTYAGNSFTSKKPVPSNVGSPNENSEYWVETGNYNSQIEDYRNDVLELSNKFNEKISWYNNVSALRTSTLNNAIVATKGYYTPGDGGEAIYYVRDKIDSDVDNGGSLLIVGNKTCVLISDIVSVKQFGARGDGVTDDYNAIKKCFSNCDNVYIPDGDYLITNGLTFLSKRLDCRGRIKVSANVTALTIGSETTLTRNIEVNGVSVIGTNLENQIGIYIVNVANSRFNHLSATECNTGVKISGNGLGVINNNFDFGKILQCYRGIEISCNDTGWVNQNIFENADIQNYTDDTRNYIKLLLNSGKNVINANTFIGFNLEGKSSGSKAIYGECAYCLFLSCRFEETGDGSVELINESNYNNFINSIIFPVDANIFVFPDTNYTINARSITGPAYGFCYTPSADRIETAFSTRKFGSDYAFDSLTSWVRSSGDAMFNSIRCNHNLNLTSGFIVGIDYNPEGSQVGYKGCLCLCTHETDYGLYLKTTGTPDSLSNTGWVKLNN